jgi:hypothetical protein
MYLCVGFEVFTAVAKGAFFWVVTPCTLEKA